MLIAFWGLLNLCAVQTSKHSRLGHVKLSSKLRFKNLNEGFAVYLLLIHVNCLNRILMPG